MPDGVDPTAAARDALMVRDAELADADRALDELVREAHRLAVESIMRIDAAAAHVDTAAAAEGLQAGPAAREVGRMLVDQTRDIAGLIATAREQCDAKVVAVQQLTERYRNAAQR